MPHARPAETPPVDDTPTDEAPPASFPTVDERAPYGDPPRWPWLVFAGVALLAVLAAIVVAGALVRAAWRRARTGDRTEVIMFPTVFSGDHGYPVYRIEFYDGSLRQLADRSLTVRLPDPHGLEADATLARVAAECVALVEARDGQRCFVPVVEVYDQRDVLVRRYRAGRP